MKQLVSYFVLITLTSLLHSSPAQAVTIDAQVEIFMDKIRLFQGYSFSAPKELERESTRAEIQSLVQEITRYSKSVLADSSLDDRELSALADQIDQCLDALNDIVS